MVNAGLSRALSFRWGKVNGCSKYMPVIGGNENARKGKIGTITTWSQSALSRCRCTTVTMKMMLRTVMTAVGSHFRNRRELCVVCAVNDRHPIALQCRAYGRLNLTYVRRLPTPWNLCCVPFRYTDGNVAVQRVCGRKLLRRTCNRIYSVFKINLDMPNC